MRALVWSEFYWPSVGGGEIFTKNLVHGLRRRGIEFAVVTGRLGEDLDARDEIDGVPVYRFPFRPAFAGRDPAALVAITDDILALVRRWRPDLVHMTWLGPCGVVFRQVRARTALPTLVTLGQHLRGDLSPASLRGRVLREAHWVAACAGWMRDSLLARIPETRERSSVLHHAVPPARSIASPSATGVAGILCLGRLVPVKGFDVALRALALLVDRFPQARLTIAGDGPERASLEALTAELGLSDQVEFLGRVHPDDSGALIAASAVVLMPSREETFGLVALEAAQQGRPIVASGVEGLAEVVADGQTGLLVPPGDAAAVAAAVAELLTDPRRRQRLGEGARARAAEVFSWERHLDAYETLYRRVAGEAGP